MSNVTSAIRELNDSVQNFSSNVDVHVRNVDATTKQLQQTAESIYQRVDKFRTDIMHGEEKQIAYENILRIDNVIREQFGNYDAIRKTIIGVVRDFDINLVRNSTIEELSEELWITSSRYWLSYALLAVTAWVNNYPEVARNALSESGRKDAIKTSLFFCLLNLRFERVETAREWFKVYCKSLDPTMLGQETSVMIQAFMGGIFGKDKELESNVSEIINDWIRIISEDAAISDGIIQDYVDYFEKFNNRGDFNYNMIAEFCANADEIKRSFVDVSKFDKLIELVDSINVESSLQTDENYKNRVDAVLMNLITNFDEEEQELRNEQKYFRLIVDNEGDKEAAQVQFDEVMEVQNERYNIGKQMVEWVVYGDEGTDVSVKKFGLQSTKDWFLAALDRWIAAVRDRCPLQYQFSIDSWTGTSNGRDLDEQRTALTNYFENNKFKMICVNTVNIALAIVFFISLIVLVAAIVKTSVAAIIIGAVLLLGSAAGIALRILSGKKKWQERLDIAVQNLEGTMAQIVEFQRYFSENLCKKDDLVSRLSFI